MHIENPRKAIVALDYGLVYKVKLSETTNEIVAKQLFDSKIS